MCSVPSAGRSPQLRETDLYIRADAHGTGSLLRCNLAFVITVELKPEYPVLVYMKIIITKLMQHKLCDKQAGHHANHESQQLIKVNALFRETQQKWT